MVSMYQTSIEILPVTNRRNCALAAVFSIYTDQRRAYLANCGSGRFDGRGGGPGRGGGRGYADRGSYGGRGGGRYVTGKEEQPRASAAAAASTSTEIVEYDADTLNVNAPARAPACFRQ